MDDTTLFFRPYELFKYMEPGSIAAADVMLMALFGGAISFATIATLWFVRERNRLLKENQYLRDTLSDHRAINERNEALFHVVDQRIVIWNRTEEIPVILGSLPKNCGIPDSRIDFLRFGDWLPHNYFRSFEESLSDLRENGSGFDITLQTNSGGLIKVQGRAYGTYAFARFGELAGESAAMGLLETRYASTQAMLDSIQTLFNQLEMQIWISGKDGKLLWINNAYVRAVEAEDAMAVINHNIQLFDRDQYDQIQKDIERKKQFGGQLSVIVSGDRKIMDVVETASKAGNAGIALDKSNVMDIQATLEKTVASHSMTLDQLATAIAIFDSEKRLQFYNSGFQKLWKLDMDFLESKPSNTEVLDAMREKKRLPPQPDWQKWRDGQLEIYQAMEAREEWWYLPDGVTLRVVVNPKNPGGATWIFEDVTEELALKSKYNSLAHVQKETLDHLSEAVAVFSSDGRLRLSNPAFWQIFRIEIDPEVHIGELAKQLVEKFKTPDIWNSIVEDIAGYDDRRTAKADRLYLANDKIIDSSLVPLPDGRTMLTLVDVTASVNFEMALTERNKALEESDNLKNQFLQHVSYELRTPLTTISGFGELLSMEQTGKLDATQNRYLSYINSSSSTLKAIIDDILDLTTIEAGIMELELQKFEIKPEIQNVVKTFSETLKQKRIDVDIVIDPATRFLIADNFRFRQIIHNLLSNAINHSPDGSTIGIDGKTDKDNVLISVSDQGPGIPADKREVVFHRFESMVSGKTRKRAGLGLSIVKSFMKLHNGGITIENAGTRGARFICSFPINTDGTRQTV